MQRLACTALLSLAGALVFAASSGCTDCEERACDAVQAPRGHAAIDQGVTGVIAYRTDGCVNDCCACSYDDAALTLMKTDQPVTRHNAASIAAQGKSSMTINAHHAYAQALDPGDYLLCVWDRCAGLHIAAGDVFTVNVQNGYGPSALIVFDPHHDEPRDDLVFSVSQK